MADDMSNEIGRLPERLAEALAGNLRALSALSIDVTVRRRSRKCCPHCGLPQ